MSVHIFDQFFVCNYNIVNGVRKLCLERRLKCKIYLQKEVCGIVMGCYDSIALFLCVHLIHQYRLLCHKRAVPSLDAHWEQLLKMIWPRSVCNKSPFGAKILLSCQELIFCCTFSASISKFVRAELAPFFPHFWGNLQFSHCFPLLALSLKH